MTAPPAGRRNQPRVAGRTTVWWGAVGAVTIFASMHSTLLFASLYFRQGATEWPPDGLALPDITLHAAIAVVALASIAPAAWAHTQVRAETVGRLQVGALLAALMGAAVAALAVADLAAAEFDWRTNAFASVYWVMTGFHLLITVVGIAMLLFAPLQVWMAPLSSRNRSIVVASAVIWYYVAGGWLVNLMALHLIPRWWGT